MSLLSIIQDHCKLHALAVPTAIIGSTDSQVIQLYAIFKDLLQDIVTESKFNVTTQEAVFSTSPSEDQGAMTDLAPSGYRFAIFETFYNRTMMLPLIGPLTETEWQEVKSLPNAGLQFRFRIRNDHLLFNPVPTVPFSDIAFEYMSSWCVKTAAGVLKETPTVDTDTFVFPENILLKGIMYRWKQIKGLPYQADETRYWNLLNNYIAKDKVKRRIDVSEPHSGFMGYRPGQWVGSH